MNLASVAPRPREVLHAARDTRLLLRLRWRLIRGRGPRLLVWLGLAALLFILVVAANVGSIILKIAEANAGLPGAEFAITYVAALRQGELGAIGAAALGSAVAAALFNPFTGAANQALVAADDLATLRPHRLHRYFDSLLMNAVSSIGALQLLSLTAVASLLTLDGGRAGGMLVTWAVWPVLILITSAIGWAVELVYRAWGAAARRTLGIGLAGAVAAALLLDPQHGRTLFGIGDAYSATLRAAAAGDSERTMQAVVVLGVAALIAFLVGILLCRASLMHPAVASSSGGVRVRRIPLSRRPKIALLQMLTTTVIRTAEVRRPLLTLVALGVPAAWFAGSVEETMSTLVLATPLAMALVWGVNAFGIIGPGMTWLASQPNALRWLFPLTSLIQIGGTLAIGVLCWLPPTLFGVLNPRDAAAVAAGLVVSSTLVGRSAASKSLHRPLLIKLGTRGDVLIPPLRALNYTVRFAIWSGVAGVIVLGVGDGWLQAGLVLTVIVWSTVRYVYLLRAWRNRERQAAITATVAAA